MRKMMSRTWRVALLRAYPFAMGIARKHTGRRFHPVPATPGLAMYEGLWVAVLDGEVVAAAATTRELVRMLADLGPKVRGATMQRVPHPEQGLLVGMG